jgi:hypothetical protein
MPKLWLRRVILAGPLAILLSAPALQVPAMAQGETTSAIVGSVTDPSGAAIIPAPPSPSRTGERPQTIRENGRLGAVQLSAAQARHVLGESGSRSL